MCECADLQIILIEKASHHWISQIFENMLPESIRKSAHSHIRTFLLPVLQTLAKQFMHHTLQFIPPFVSFR